MNKPAYVLGHSDRELARLTAQARLLERVTRQFLLDAGIRAGMRVLDIGSGARWTAEIFIWRSNSISVGRSIPLVSIYTTQSLSLLLPPQDRPALL